MSNCKMNFCKCGCKKECKGRFVHGHNSKNRIITDLNRKNIKEETFALFEVEQKLPWIFGILFVDGEYNNSGVITDGKSWLQFRDVFLTK